MAARSAYALVVLMLACLLVAGPRAAESLSCGNVVSFLSPCINYASGKGPLTASCCSGVKGLTGLAKTTADRQTACNCLKSTTASIPGIKPGLVSGIPGRCQVSVPYPISTSTDCSKVK